MFVSGFPSLRLSLCLFPHTNNSKQLHFFSTSLLLSLTLPVSPPLPLKYNSSPPPCCLYTPANLYSPACVCAPVWLLAWSVWTLRRRKTCQVEHIWEELWHQKERAPVVQASRFSIRTLKPRRLCKLYQEGVFSEMHMLCSNSQNIDLREYV